MEILKSSSLLKSAHQTPKVIIFSDASYDNSLKTGAWFCYIRIDDEVTKTGGLIRHKLDNSTEAERVGIANSLWLVNRMVDISKKKLLIYCDNMAAVKPVTIANKTGKDKQKAKEQLVFYQKNIEPFIQKANQIDIRYIKGHATRSKRMKLQVRHLVHDMCDRESKRLLDEYRQSLLTFNEMYDNIKYEREGK